LTAGRTNTRKHTAPAGRVGEIQVRARLAGRDGKFMLKYFLGGVS
jgi:hypothetical protein